jgi:adenosine kinase
MKGILLGICNPLLDISANNVKTEVFDKYGLKFGNAILAEPTHLPLYEELKKDYEVEYIAGGAGQNSIRACQWMLQEPGVGGYIGCVGNDENGKTLKAAAEKDGVVTHYLVDETIPTGTCAVLVKEKERSLVANLGAAEAYKESHLESSEIKAALETTKFIYATSFFLTHSAPVVLKLAQHAHQHNKQFLLNLSAPFLIQFFWEKMEPVLPYTDVIFGNETEAAALGERLGWGEDLETIALKMSEYKKEGNNKRLVIFTQGANQTLVAHNGKVSKFTPLKVDSNEIVDTNGAGDSFVGGFLSRYIQGKPLEECIAAGHYCASECIKRSGCTFPEKPNFTF